MKQLRWFGTDGIRGIEFEGLFIPSILTRIGCALSEYLYKKFHVSMKNSRRPLWVLIATDTRRSGDEFSRALSSGLKKNRVKVAHLGVCSSSALAWLTRYYTANFGIMVSASHNPAVYNGIKCFDSMGRKLSVEEELEIEMFIDHHTQDHLVKDVARQFERKTHYTRMFSLLPYKRALIQGRNLKGLRVVLDGAHGSLWNFATHCFTLCGAEVVETLGNAPDGYNINEDVGVLYPHHLQKAVLTHSADLGFSFDGDGDRVGVVDALGRYWNGDHILAVLAQDASCIVGTVMSNYGLERYWNDRGKSFLRVEVGDRWISQALKAHGLRWGGESSGHIIDDSFLPVGDGLWIALQVSTQFLKGMKAPLFPAFIPYPVLQSTIPKGRTFSLRTPENQSYLRTLCKSLEPNVRLVVRPSGTEPVIRILVEGPCLIQLKSVMEQVTQWLSGYHRTENMIETTAA